MGVSITAWTLAVGTTGFVTGYVGPILLTPGANQGPLLGIFLTGPGGLALGAVMGLVMKLLGVRDNVSLAWLAGTCAVVAMTTLYLCVS